MKNAPPAITKKFIPAMTVPDIFNGKHAEPAEETECYLLHYSNWFTFLFLTVFCIKASFYQIRITGRSHKKQRQMRQRFSSIGKVYVATAIVLLVDDGKVSLDEMKKARLSAFYKIP